MGHARALLALESPVEQIEACQTIISEGLNVRETEKMINQILYEEVSRETITEPSTTTPSTQKKQTEDPNLRDITEKLTRHFGTKINIKGQQNKGRLEIEYYSQEEFERILDLLLKG
jgi:ParB family chromosome partitioning protein